MFRYSHHGQKPTLIVPSFNTQYGKRSFSVMGPRLFNKLPVNVTSADSVDVFKSSLKTFLFKLAPGEADNLFKY